MANAIHKVVYVIVHQVRMRITLHYKSSLPRYWLYSIFLGWTGDVCANRCPTGTYGQNCEQACECFNGGYCHHITGECECAAGFMGNKCLDSCPSNTFGLNCTETCRCLNGATCNASTGSCSCTPGWKAVDCARRLCADGYYGDTCNKTCECEKENTKMCHPWTGKCDCKAGWSSVLCNRPCPFLTYGENCHLSCECKNGAQCSAINGKERHLWFKDQRA